MLLGVRGHRYNDITRPRALRVGGDGTQQTPRTRTTHSRLWDSSGILRTRTHAVYCRTFVLTSSLCLVCRVPGSYKVRRSGQSVGLYQL